ncbi:MAG: hypothetical protein ABJO09_08210 [Hyphomicrobiales bacterium]
MIDWLLDNIVLVHYLLFWLGFVLAVIPSFKSGLSYYFWDVVGLAAVVFAVICLMLISNLPPSEGKISEEEKMFLLMAFSTAGIGPLLSTVSFVLSGRLAGRYVRGIGSWIFGLVRGRGQEA